MLVVNKIVKRYGDDLVLDQVSFTLDAGERVGLVGPNGCGKSTLLRIIAGIEQPDAGRITRVPSNLTLGYLPQGWEGPPGMRIAAALWGAQSELDAARAELDALEQRMAASGLARAELDLLLEAYAAAQARFEALGGYAWEHRAAEVLAGLGLADLPPTLPVAALSGGQKTRLGLARLLLARPALLLLDEPTNHLDMDALEWLERFLTAYDGAVLLVSHDRAFLDRVVTRILELTPIDRFRATSELRSYVGGYREYAAAKERERAAQLAAWQDQQFYIAEVEADIQTLKGMAQRIQQGPKRGRDHFGRVSAKVARLARARERKLERYQESEGRVEKPRQEWKLKLDFDSAVDGARVVLRVENLAFSYPPAGNRDRKLEMRDSRQRSLPSIPQLLHDISFELTYGERVAVVGPNGAGKTTLLRLITGQLEPCAGRVVVGPGVRIGYLAQEQETLDGSKTVLESLRDVVPWSETEARSFLHRYLFSGDEVFRPVAACSFGERARLALALMIAQGCTFLVLDEPINHLDIPARERFEAALASFPGTILTVAHDRYFLEQFARRVLALRDGRLLDYPGGYADFVQRYGRGEGPT
jgi:ATP-binding cassette subfamily F protein 3